MDIDQKQSHSQPLPPPFPFCYSPEIITILNFMYISLMLNSIQDKLDLFISKQNLEISKK